MLGQRHDLIPRFGMLPDQVFSNVKRTKKHRLSEIADVAVVDRDEVRQFAVYDADHAGPVRAVDFYGEGHYPPFTQRPHHAVDTMLVLECVVIV